MVQIKAPYNFVPLEEKAFYPSWANHISQDIPFEDGVSGSIEYTITAETPIFVRNGQKKDAGDNTFSHTSDGRYFIPGTSIKGEIRNVLEILSFGKMTQVQDARFGIRDLGNNSEGIGYRKKLQRGVFCGWLKKDKDENGGDVYVIEDCGRPGRISPREIDRHFRSSLENFDLHIGLGAANNGNAEDEELRSASHKYRLLGLINNDENHLSIDMNSLEGCFVEVGQDEYGKTFYGYNNAGNDGTIVLTGQPSRRRQLANGRWTGKYYEFIFFQAERTIKVGKDVIEDFLTIHKNNYDFLKLWKSRLNLGGKIPVFFMKDDRNSVSALGLAYMFRYPTANFIKGAIPAELQSSCHKDLAECMFGTESETLRALKGRVYFSPAFAEGNPQKLAQVDTTLSSPKPSFGPLYVKGGTWNDSNAMIKGRKRYPVRERVWNNEQGNENTGCSFIPLAGGTVFKGVVRFHNLKLEEYGALLAALTFNGHSECFHSIGEAKPLGYGKVKIDIQKTEAFNIVFDKEVEKETALESFRSMMMEFDQYWDRSASLNELYAMAKGIRAGREDDFKYLRMSTNADDNEFKAVKEGRQNLPLFSNIGNPQVVNPGVANEIKRKESLVNEIKRIDEKLKGAEDIQTIKRYLKQGDLLKAKEKIDSLDNQAPEKAALASELLNLVQMRLVPDADNRYDEFMQSYQQMPPEEAIKLAESIIEDCSILKFFLPAEAEYRKIEIEKIKEELEREISDGGLPLLDYFAPIALNSIPSFANNLKKWMKATKTERFTENLAIELGQIVNGKMEGLNSRNKKAWKNRKQWKPISDLIGDEMAAKAFDQLKNE